MRKVEIDQDTCTECGNCVGICSEVYEIDAAGKARLVEKYRTNGETSGEVPDDIKWVEAAADECPVEAITVS